MKIFHKLRNHKISPDTNILIIGTFNPDVQGNEADFFYGRSRNFLWSLLPQVFNEKSLKTSTLDEKKSFINKYNIDFIDLIDEIEIEPGNENNYADDFIDDKVIKWKDIVGVIKSNQNIREVYFTRKTFAGIPNIRKKIKEIENYCKLKGIRFSYLPTPARFENAKKLADWKEKFSR